MGPKNLNEKVDQLREALQDVVAQEEKLKSDLYLYHWLREFHADLHVKIKFLANKYNPKKTEKAIRENLKWRQENGIKELAQSEFDPELEAKFAYFHAEGIGGIPVAFHSVATDFAEILDEFGKKRLLHHLAQLFAKQENLVHEFDKTWTGSIEDLPPERSMGCCIIGDMDGYSIKQNLSVKVLQYFAECSKMMVNYFPAAGRVAKVINATKLVEIPLHIIKPIVSGRYDLDVHGKNEEDVTVVSEVLTPQQLRDLQTKAKEMLGRS